MIQHLGNLLECPRKTKEDARVILNRVYFALLAETHYPSKDHIFDNWEAREVISRLILEI